jgi:hypothetical protein
MERKLALISETAGTLIELVHNQRSLRLEWYISASSASNCYSASTDSSGADFHSPPAVIENCRGVPRRRKIFSMARAE